MKTEQEGLAELAKLKAGVQGAENLHQLKAALVAFLETAEAGLRRQDDGPQPHADPKTA